MSKWNSRSSATASDPVKKKGPKTRGQMLLEAMKQGAEAHDDDG
jgi:hypothetical protein